MTDVTDELGTLIKKNLRPWNSFWSWRLKSVGEHGAAREILQAAGLKVEALRSRPDAQDTPDCEGTVDGQWSGIEVTELVHRLTLEQSLKALKEREAGREPTKPEVYFQWDRNDLVQALQGLITRKDAAKLKGGPYQKYILIIHTDEFLLNRGTVDELLQNARFTAQSITDVLLGLSYEPDFGIPTFRLNLDDQFGS